MSSQGQKKMLKNFASQFLMEYNAVLNMTKDPWPSDALLYQPEPKQILLPEKASCISVQAYLKMCKLPYQVRACANAEFMSPGGRGTKVPFIRVGDFVFAEFEPIVKFVEHKDNIAIGSHLSETEKFDMRAFTNLAEFVFTLAEIYITFKDPRVYKEMTAPRIASVYPWPLNMLETFMKRRQGLRLLKIYQWSDMTMQDVIELVQTYCITLIEQLNSTNSPYFFGNDPCELDAIVFGHVYSIIKTKLPNMELAQAVQRFRRLVEFCDFIKGKYFKEN